MFEGLDSMDFASGGLGLVGLLISSFVYLRSARLKNDVEHETVATEQMQTIFDGYSQIVASLQDELERLKVVIEDMQIEQQACDQRNELLTIEVTELRERIATLESKRGRLR